MGASLVSAAVYARMPMVALECLYRRLCFPGSWSLLLCVRWGRGACDWTLEVEGLKNVIRERGADRAPRSLPRPTLLISDSRIATAHGSPSQGGARPREASRQPLTDGACSKFQHHQAPGFLQIFAHCSKHLQYISTKYVKLDHGLSQESSEEQGVYCINMVSASVHTSAHTS